MENSNRFIIPPQLTAPGLRFLALLVSLVLVCHLRLEAAKDGGGGIGGGGGGVPTLGVEILESRLSEIGPGIARIRFVGATGVPRPVSLNLSGTAQRGVDYLVTPATPVVNEIITIQAIQDDLLEGDESIIFVGSASGFNPSSAQSINLADNPPGPPSFVSGPESVQTWIGASVDLSGVISGSLPMHFQWRLNGEPLPDATDHRLHLTQLQLSSAGDYDLVASNTLGSATSIVARVTVMQPPDGAMIVFSTADDGPGSLRQAILDANATPGTNSVLFQIPGAVAHLIRPISPLPPISEAVVLDGTTQSGYSDTPLVEIRGDQAGSGVSGLVLQAPSTVRGLSICGWQGNGMELQAPGGHLIHGNFIGVSPFQTAPVPNAGVGLLIVGADDNRIGGTLRREANVVSGNNLSGVEITGGARGNLLTGNLIGTDPSGSYSIPNGGAGILISSSSENRIGGFLPGEGNTISGNLQSGINLNINQFLVPPQGASGNVIQGNFVGVNKGGAFAVPNGGSGILVFGDCSATMIGGTNTLAGNTISGNRFNGIEIVGNARDTRVLGNRIGTDLTGRLKIPNALDGVLISGAGSGLYPVGTWIGDTVNGGGNIISGNNYSGIELNGRGEGTRIIGNFIGTDLRGELALGNLFAGIFVSQEASATPSATAGLAISRNTIAFNLEAGVDVQDRRSLGNPYNTGISIRQNSIFSNNLLGIDLQPTGQTPNDEGDLDLGANGGQNYPGLTNVIVSASGKATVQGFLNSRPNLSYLIDFYGNTECDPDGHGEGQTWLAATNVRTDQSGNAVFAVTLDISAGNNRWITATATDSGLNTSEFSTCLEVSGGQTPLDCEIQSMVAWWPGDVGVHDVVGNNSGNLRNGAKVVPGLVGQAFQFDGVDDYVATPAVGLPIGSAARSIELWVWIEGFSVGDQVIMAGYGSYGSDAQIYALGALPDHRLFFSQWGEAILGPTLIAGKWYHVAVTSVGNSEKLYLDGALVGLGNLPLNTPPGTTLYLGHVPGSWGVPLLLNGRLDEVSIYNRALSASEIKAIYEMGSAGKCFRTAIRTVRVVENALEFKFQSLPSLIYQLEAAPDLVGPWTSVGDSIVGDGSPRIVSYRDIAHPRGFFRISRLP